MSTRKWVDKKKATKFALVHRSHEDPLYYDTDAPDHVLMPIRNGNDKNPKTRLETKDELERKLKDEKMRENEGEAALYGITFDDSKYDYMQHLKPIGNDKGGIFIERKTKDDKKAPKKDLLKDLEEVLPSENKLKLDYQDQQDVQDTIKGFKPDMDPRLREVLEALEDEAYLDEAYDVEEGDIFDDLLQGGAAEGDEDYDEYDLDQYEDEFDEYDSGKEQTWEDDFNKFKKQQKNLVNEWDSDDDFSRDGSEEDEDEVPELPQINADSAASKSKKSKQKARRAKGAMTDTSSYSMSSSALFRTDGLRLLDDRYEQLLKKQEREEEEEEDYQPFDMSKERPDLESMLDDFLDNYEVEGGRRIVKKNAEKDKLQQAALSVSKSKMVAKKKKESGMSEVEKTLKNLRL